MPDNDEYEYFDESDLLRRIHPEHIIFDKNLNEFRPTSQNFGDEKMSVDIETILTANGLDWKCTLRNHDQYSLVRFPASLARGLTQTVYHCRTLDNPAHGEVRGKKTGSVRSRFSKLSKWVHLNPPK